MVKTLLLGLLAATICGFVQPAPTPVAAAAAAQRADTAVDVVHQEVVEVVAAEEDPAARSERSTNLSHVTGAARKIQMFIKNRHLQILPDGTVNGTTDDASSFTILQRTTVGIGQMKIQGVATCQYLCMDGCGLLYGSRDFGDECVFNETIEQSNYNTYLSSKYSNGKRTFYLALNRHGQPRKVVLRHRHQLGKLSSYTRVLTRNVPPELHPVRHRGHACPPASPEPQHRGQQPPRCRGKKKKKKKKKKKRKCADDESDAEPCPKRHATRHGKNDKKCNADDRDGDSDVVCQRDADDKRRRRVDGESDGHVVSVPTKKKKKAKKGARRREQQQQQQLEAATTTQAAPTVATTYEDYAAESSTHSDWEEATAVPEVAMGVASTARPPFEAD